MESRKRIDLLPDLELGADSERAERQPEIRLLEEVLDLVPQRASEGLRVRALEANGHIGDRDHAVEVDDDRDQPLALPVPQRAPDQARLAVLSGRIETDEVAAEGLGEQLLDLVIPVDEVLGLEGMRVDERVDVGDLGYVRSIPAGMSLGYLQVCLAHTSRVSGTM